MTTRDVVRDDRAVAREPNRWLGPDQFTLPKPVRYSTLGTWFGLSLAAVVAGFATYAAGVLGPVNAAVVTFWGLCAVVALTYWLSKVTDSDVPVRSIPAFAAAEFRAWLQRPGPVRVHRFTAMHVRGINPERDRMSLRKLGLRYAAAGGMLVAIGIAAVIW